MAHLPPSAVFGALQPGQAVHVLLLIENSLPMAEHREDLQYQVLPGLLGAVRLANPGGNVEIFWETTGKTQEQQSKQKEQRHFNDFPDIDIVGLPQNKLSPLFVRKSVDLFLLNNAERTKSPATQHLVIVAMSNPADDDPGTSDKALVDSQVTWESVAEKLQKNRIIVHVVANPAARMTRIFDLFRKTLRAQWRQEVIPWQSSDTSRCVCHLSGASMSSRDHGRPAPQDEWPEISPSANDPYDSLVSSSYQSQYPTSAMSAYGTSQASSADTQAGTHLLNNQAGHHTQASVVALVDPSTNEPMTVGGPVSLVSRMQALHGLAKRRPERERARAAHTSFFREPDAPRPGGNPAGGVERTERPRPRHNLATSPLGLRPALPPTSSSDTRNARQGGSRARSGTGPTSPERRGGRRARAGSRSSTTTAMTPSAAYNLPPSSPSSDGSPGSTPSPMWPSSGVTGNTAVSTQTSLNYPGPPTGFTSSVSANAIPLTEYGLRRYSSNTHGNANTGGDYGLGLNMRMVVPSQAEGSHRYGQSDGQQQLSYNHHSHPSMSMPNTPLNSLEHLGSNISMSVPATPLIGSETMNARGTGHGSMPIYQHSTLTMLPPPQPGSYASSASAPAMISNNTNYFSLPYSSSSELSSTASMPSLPTMSRNAMNLHLSMPIANTLPVSPSGELEVVPASAPLDPAGEVPFIIDEEAEKRAEIKLERALKAMREEARVQNTANAANAIATGNLNTYPTMNVGGGVASMSEAGSLSPTRTQASSSSSFSLPNSPISQFPPNAPYDPAHTYMGLSYASSSSSTVQK